MKTQNLVEELKRYGIRTAEYVRPPIGKDVFAISIQPKHKEGVVTVNQGTAKVKVHGSKRLRQATVTVQENGRSVSRNLMAVLHQENRPTYGERVNALKGRFPVVMPPGAIWSGRDITCTRHAIPQGCRDDGSQIPDDIRYHISGTITATVKDKTINHFLIGMDETRHFISPLPKHATSVQEAHRLLKPDRKLRAGTKRQGEWFFIPCGKTMVAKLDKIATEDQGRIRPIILGDTTHRAKSALDIPDTRYDQRMLRSRKIYARGYITENRTGHHKALFLTEWHEVVKNKEAEITVAPWQKEAMRRRRATFD